MGWRDRDYARFRKDEFDAIYGRAGDGIQSAGTKRGTAPVGMHMSLFRVLRIPVLAVGGTAALMGLLIATGRADDFSTLMDKRPSSAPAAFNHLPTQLAPEPTPIRMPAAPRVTRIAGTRLLTYGGSMTLSDSHTRMAGKIVVSGRWGSGDWETFAVARGDRPTYSFRIPLTRHGVLRIRVAYPDGSRAVGTYQVR